MGLKSKLKHLVQKNPWGKVQFFHQQRTFVTPDGKRFTAAVEMPTKNQLLRFKNKLSSSNRLQAVTPKLILKFGKSVVNPIDQYVRQIGRETAFKRLTPHTFFLNKVEVTCGKIDFYLDGVADGLRVGIGLTLT